MKIIQCFFLLTLDVLSNTQFQWVSLLSVAFFFPSSYFSSSEFETCSLEQKKHLRQDNLRSKVSDGKVGLKSITQWSPFYPVSLRANIDFSKKNKYITIDPVPVLF